MSGASSFVMTAARRMLLTIACASLGLVSGCNATPRPSATATTATVGPSETIEAIMPLPSDVVTDQLGSPWRRSPIVVDERHVAIISDACAAAAREELGENEANLPTALIDARGEHLVTAILADDLDAIVCLVRLDETGLIATVDSVDRLSTAAVEPVDATKISVATVAHLDDLPGGRTLAFGRLGPVADAAKVGFDNASVILASDAEGWWAMWWRGAVRASSYAAVDKASIAIGSATPFDGEREARVGPAAWWVDPTATPLPTATTIRALVREETCASGRTPDGRVDPPEIEVTDASITVRYWIRKLPGAQDCQGNAPFPVMLELPERLGARALLDGSETPPRDAMKPPSP